LLYQIKRKKNKDNNNELKKNEIIVFEQFIQLTKISVDQKNNEKN